MNIDRKLALLLAVTSLLPACAVAPPQTAETAGCRQLFAQVDAQVERVAMRDAGAFPVQGFPYLRVDRLLMSFAPDAADGPAFDAWVGHMRKLDLDRRKPELRNARIDPATWTRLDECGGLLARLELTAPREREKLRRGVRAPDDYSLAARLFGLYPFAVPFLNRGIGKYHDEVRADYATPLAQLDAPGTLVAWSPPPSPFTPPGESLAAVQPDALGIPRIGEALWSALLAQHAPTFWVEVASGDDRLGRPALQPDGSPGFDPADPVVFTQTGFTRFGAEVLPVLTYVAWFAGRPPEEDGDSYAGALDGIVWRVVLDRQGRALTYDTIHPCGCYRYYFPAQELQRFERSGFWQEPVLFPQADVPPGPLALRIQSGKHFLRRVVPARAAAGRQLHYRLRPYEELLALPDGHGGTRSLFGEDGIVAGTERGERRWLWITGIPNPGAMRELGRHPTSFVGRSHFDDARFLEMNFVPPTR